MKALVGAFNQEKALLGAFSVIVQPVVEPMEHYTALIAGDVVAEDDRIQIKKLDKGVHRMIVLRARITDTGDVSCTCVGQNETKAQLIVNKAAPPEVEAKDQDADDGKVKAKAKGMFSLLYA